jgi:[ribosomal protein S5]-alanine N-acetyltransferase
MKPIETERLIIRDFVRADGPLIYQILDKKLDWSNNDVTEEERWWCIMATQGHSQDKETCLGMKAIVLKKNGEVIGTCGVKFRLDYYFQFPSLRPSGESYPEQLRTVEFGLGYDLSPSHWGQGYAVEASSKLTRIVLETLRILRVVSLTDRNNKQSVRVMENIGMTVEKNPLDVDWPAYAGVLYNPLELPR